MTDFQLLCVLAALLWAGREAGPPGEGLSAREAVLMAANLIGEAKHLRGTWPVAPAVVHGGDNG